MADTLTMEDLNVLKEKCEDLTKNDKILHFKDHYLEPDMVKNAIESLMNKVNMATIGIDKLDDSDKLLLFVIQSQKGYLY
jgi:homoaconitase/3-isopropylmalate dehydratase large subunit